MLSSPHKIRFAEPLRDARVHSGREVFLSESAMRGKLEENYQTGFDAGQKALREELVKQRTELLEIQNNVLRSLERALPSLAAQCEKDLISLALLAARRAVHETPISAELVEAMLKQGLAELQGTTEYQVRLNPEDFAMLQEMQSRCLPSSATSKVSFVGDPSLARASCLIHTQHGAIELNREKSFAKLEAAAS